MKTLTLSLKKQWFDMIKSGEKKEEYREIKEKVENAPEDAVWKIEMNVVTREDGTPGKPGEKTIEEFSKKEILEILKAAYEYKRGDL